ncbi:MAG: hypothetical protein OXE57_01290 [Alphaproteobacteria bacterium]|nr:hypothetical protein [Alphaproteobacteria bacterium]
MLLAKLPNRSPFSRHQPPADRSLNAPALPFTLICRDALYEDSCLAFHRYAYLEDCIHDIRLALDEIYDDADEYASYLPDAVNDVAHTVEIYAHGEHCLTIAATGHDIDATGRWSQVWPFLAKPFALYTPDTDPSRFPDIFPF